MSRPQLDGAADGPPIRSIQEECALLAPLESFDPGVFRGNSAVPQTVCNFVLALALIYNDCKGTVHAHSALAQAAPTDRKKRTRALGAIAGAQFHAVRMAAGLIHELLVLIRENEGARKQPFFVRLIDGLHAESRRGWHTLVGAAADKTPKEPLGKRIARLRNKVQFHYDSAEIFQGYSEYFLKEPKSDDRAYISRGETMRATRLYFADAAATGYTQFLLGTQQASLSHDLALVIKQMNYSLYEIVLSFIHRRNGTYQREPES
jgi:hypothetical protein